MSRTLQLLLALVVLLALGAPAAGAEQRLVTLLSDGPSSPDPAIPAFVDGASDDGLRAFFRTEERLAASDTDDVGDVYERTAGALIHVSAGSVAELEARWLDASATRSLFQTSEALLAADTGTGDDIYERTVTGELTLVSGGDGARTTFERATPDGSHVYFTTSARLAPATDTDDAETSTSADRAGCGT